MKRFFAFALVVTLCAQAPMVLFAQEGVGSEPVQSTDEQVSGKHLLLKSRQALSKGDVATAKTLVAEARKHADADSGFDSPASVEAMIARHGELAQMARTGEARDYNHGAALFLLEQAESLIQYKDYTTAEALILQAKQFPTQYQPGDQNPDTVMAKLEEAKGSSAVAETNVSLAKTEAAKLLSRAQLAYDQKNFEEAAQLIAQVKALNVPTSAFSDDAIRPWELELKIRDALSRSSQFNNSVVEAAEPMVEGGVENAVYDPSTDETRDLPASFSADGSDDFDQPTSRGQQLYESGQYALNHNDSRRALEYFRLAWQYEDQLDPQTRAQLREQLTQLQRSTPSVQDQDESFEEIQGVDQALRQKIQNEVIRERAAAEQMMQNKNPRGALEHMQLLREKVTETALDDVSKRQLINAIDREISEISAFIEINLTQIETDEFNKANIADVEMGRQRRYDIERKISQLVEDFEKLKHEQRYHEAMAIAQQAMLLAPEMEVVQAMNEKAKFMYREAEQRAIAEGKAEYFLDGLADSERAAIGRATMDNPLNFNTDTTRWDQLTARRREMFQQQSFQNETERDIYYRLRNQKIQYEFDRTPFSEALDILATRAGVNIVPDTYALGQEGVAPDHPVDMRLSEPISIHSALNLILGNLQLVYVIEDEVVKVTSKEVQQRDQKRQTYYVGDLVVPVPNFQTGTQMTWLSPMGQQNAWGRQNMGMNNGQVPMVMDMSNQTMPVSTDVMGQQIPNNVFGGNNAFGGNGGVNAGMPMANQFGPPSIGSPGGITEDDFEDLMELIQETIFPDSWEENGGTGRMQPFPANLSLVVTATQEVQEEIANLLERLRQLNDVQIVIEVRFITLNDDFFEKLGVDFDFKIEDGSSLALNSLPPDQVSPSAIVGRQGPSGGQIPTGDLDLLFNQDSFASAIPAFGAPDLGSAANFGFAILSDIEVWFLIQAAKGDTRTNVVQAPTVTMFNGQSATVNDITQNPFVTQIVPVVGDFAAAQQPIISLLPEGTQLNVQAVVSPDRRFVRMTMVPFFSQIESVSTFTFEGSTTTRRDSRTDLGDIIDILDGDDDTDPGEEVEIIEEGTTVQLPVLAVTNVSTTVSVPDGGTVLLGGIKRMSEGRIERGVPMLSNIPYVNRLFKNVAIGRTTESLMMMVTPRIIITEEEELDQTGINSRAN